MIGICCGVSFIRQHGCSGRNSICGGALYDQVGAFTGATLVSGECWCRCLTNNLGNGLVLLGPMREHNHHSSARDFTEESASVPLIDLKLCYLCIQVHKPKG